MEIHLTQITNYLLTQSWQIAVLVVVISAATFALRNKSAHVRYLLWLIVLAKCLTPPLLEVPLAVLPDKAPAPAVMTAPIATITNAPSEASRPVKLVPVVAPVAHSRPQLSTRQWLAIGWLVGAAAFACIAAVKAWRTVRWLHRDRRPLPHDIQIGVNALLSPLNLRKLPRMWVLEGIGQPFVWGALRGDIYLPATFVRVPDDEHRRHVLGHEISHVMRFDAAINLVQTIVQALLWFHPFVWWANKKIRAEREKCCDEMAIARLNACAKDYSRAIVETLVTEYESTRPVPSLAIAGPLENVQERIKTVMKPGKRFLRRPSLIVVTFILMLALLTVPTMLVLTARARTETKQTSTDALDTSRSNKRVTCKGRVVDARGRPISGAKVAAYEMEFDGLAGNFMLRPAGEVITANDGSYSFTTDQNPERSRRYRRYIVAAKDGLALGWTAWEMREDAESDIELGEPVRLEGKVVDDEGKPVIGAEVRANFYQTTKATNDDQKKQWTPGIAPISELGTFTNSQGKFLFDNLPADMDVDLLVTAKGKAITYTRRPEPQKPTFRTGQTDIRVVLPEEARIEGRIVDRKTGKPIARTKFAVVAEFTGLFYYRFVHTTDDDGVFSIGGLQTGRYCIRNGGFPSTSVDVRSGKTTRLNLHKPAWEGTRCFHVLLDRGSPEVLRPKKKITVRFEQNEGVRDAGFIDVDGYLQVSLSEKEYRQWQLGKGWFTALIPQADGKPPRREEIFSYDDLRKVWPKNTAVKKTEPKEESGFLVGKLLPEFDGKTKLKKTRYNSDYNMLLVCFFDMEQRPSRNRLEQLNNKAQELYEKDVKIVAVNTLRVDETTLGKWLKNRNITLDILTVPDDVEKIRSAWGILALPWLILTDNNHIVSAEGFALKELDEKIKALAEK